MTTAMQAVAGLLVVVLCMASGCASAGRVTETVVVGGFYAGSLFVDGQAFGAAMNLRGSAPNRVRGAFSTSSPVSIEGDVEGAVVDRLLRITVEYRTPDGCEGRIEGILDVEAGGDALEGPVTVSDCQEPVAASLTLRRREARRAPGSSTCAPTGSEAPSHGSECASHGSERASPGSESARLPGQSARLPGQSARLTGQTSMGAPPALADA
ncbi:MAG: hypothetical protein KJO65_10575 [Gemmatimonadetes bacterium]|nr:hypothetical protein [Gemmatimonadota bacterium]